MERTAHQAVRVGGTQSGETSDAETRPRTDLLIDLTCRRSLDPIDTLSRRLNDVCTRAVDPLQIAAALEADGVGDQQAADQFGSPDVFLLAEDLYSRVPLRVPPYIPKYEMDDAPAWRDLSRGVLFVLPGALYIAAVHGLNSNAAMYALLASLIFAWVWGQGSGYLGHILIGREAYGAARRVVLSLGAVGMGIAALISWIVMVTGSMSTDVFAITVAQTTYLLSASVLLLFRKEHLLFAILIPGVIASVLLAFGPASMNNMNGAAVVVVVTIAIVAVAAVVSTRTARDIKPAKLMRLDWVSAVPYMVLGLAWASLVSFSALVALDGGDGGPSIGVTIVPLLLSMGVAEWSLRRYLEMSDTALQVIDDPRLFVGFARSMMWRAVGAYTFVVLLLTGAAAVLISSFTSFSAMDFLMMIAFAQLGAAFLLGQILASRQRLLAAVAVSVASVVLLIGLVLAFSDVLQTASLEVAYVISTAFLAATLLVLARGTVGLVTTYR